jgi:RNA polymerase sigma-70 factor (ECF subfamily)
MGARLPADGDMQGVNPSESMAGQGAIPGGSPPEGAGLSAGEFAALFQRWSRALWTIAAGVLGDPSEAEDILQEAALSALAKLDQFDRGTNFAGWMGRFVRNVALNHARKRARRATEPVDPAETAELAQSREPVLLRLPVDERGALLDDQEAFDDRVLAALRELGEEQRAVLLLRTVMGLSYREISQITEMPEGTAMSHVHRAREALRDKLQEHEPGHAARTREADLR